MSGAERFPPRPDPAAARALRRRLLAWYLAERRDLPWRRTRDPYAIWISEAMLQQTRVETVVPYWERFLERFPDVDALAEAGEEELLAAWSGLGYYRRARALQAAARVIVEEHGGEFPRDRAAVLALPGVGPYTAGAVLSIAFDAAEPLVDGNVARVFCRLFGLDAPADSAALKRELWERAEALLPRRAGPRGPGAWNQAVMELGAMLCTPREPHCMLCPLRRDCRALAEGRVARLPRPGRRAEPVDVELEVLLVVQGGRLLLVRRPPEGRMAGMWECPTRELGSSHLWPRTFPGTGLVAGEELGEVRHGITRHRIKARVRAGRRTGRGRLPAGLAWYSPEAIQGLGLTGMTRKVLDLQTGTEPGSDPTYPNGPSAVGV